MVTEISPSLVSRCLQHLLDQGNLLAHSRPLDVISSEWFQAEFSSGFTKLPTDRLSIRDDFHGFD